MSAARPAPTASEEPVGGLRAAPRYAALRAAPRPAPAPPRPRLRVVSQPRRAPRAPFVLLVCALLVGGLVAVLVLNTWLAQGSFTLRHLQREQQQLADQAQALNRELQALEAPEALAARASALGLVPAPNPVFRNAATGAVLGVPNPASPPPSPAASPAASTTPTPTPATPARSPSPSPHPTGPTPAASPHAAGPTAPRSPHAGTPTPSQAAGVRRSPAPSPQPSGRR
ncbi:MAG: septum formation initiator family protein [Acidothermus sp.]|nr:septum formation initiator family protein [Acidothermus sp.]MCL6537796.1 hypothetical protein [Acidothermus sp.]